MIKPWQQVGSSHLGDFRIFTLRSDAKISPRTGKQHDFYVIECVDWVNVVALTPNREVVMVEQYRHGSNTVELEIPGGMMDPEDNSPVLTGLRELQEETGYEGDSHGAKVIGTVFPNPAIQCNRAFTVLVENCHCKHQTRFDSSEDLITRLVPIADIPKLVSSGQIRHSIVVAALYHFDLWRQSGGRI